MVVWLIKLLGGLIAAAAMGVAIVGAYHVLDDPRPWGSAEYVLIALALGLCGTLLSNLADRMGGDRGEDRREE